MSQLVLTISEWMNFSEISSFINRMLTKYQDSRIEKQTIRELSALSDRELYDIGISRASIPEIASGDFWKSTSSKITRV